MKVQLKNITFTSSQEIDINEAKAYVDRGLSLYGDKLEKIVAKPVNDKYIDLYYHCKGQKFDRIRRITGYLVGNMNTWNNAKKAEEADRVKHIKIGE